MAACKRAARVDSLGPIPAPARAEFDCWPAPPDIARCAPARWFAGPKQKPTFTPPYQFTAGAHIEPARRGGFVIRAAASDGPVVYAGTLTACLRFLSACYGPVPPILKKART